MDEQVAALVRHIGIVYNVVLYRDPDTAEINKHGNDIVNGQSLLDFLSAVVFSDERRSIAKSYVRPGHFYSPIANPAELGAYVEAIETGVTEITGVPIDRAAMLALWTRLLPLMASSPFPETETAGFRYRYENNAYGFGDAIVLQAMIRDRKPKRLIEIGSGYSSACTIDTVDRFLGGACELTFIEPYAGDRLRGLIGERERSVTIVEAPVQSVSVDVFAPLEAGDILFIDSTHIMRAGSDVCYELFEILPRLAPGVAVHIHDMFWPFEYPRPWLLDDNRSWNELYAVRAFLTGSEQWRVLFFGDYLAKVEPARVGRDLPRFASNAGASLWLERQ